MLNGKSARVKGILDRALGPSIKVVDVKQSVPVTKLVVSKYSLKSFSRDDSMYGEPESIRASVEREVRKMKLTERKLTEEKQKMQLRQQFGSRESSRTQEGVQHIKKPAMKNEWILKDDLD